MSNSNLPVNPPANGGISYRPATPYELPVAAGMILAEGRFPAAPAQIAEFLNTARDRGIDISQIWVAELGGKVLWTVLPVRSPGRTMLLLFPAYIADGTIAGRLIEAVCRHYAQMDVHLAQVLLDPAAKTTCNLLTSHQFAHMAELIYLQTNVHRAARTPALPEGLALRTYSQDTHGLFAEAILQSYQQSLDCPALSGMRDIEDIILGHKATGEFNPNLWTALCRGDEPLGVLLLSGIARTDVIELVYLGLTPAARGQGLGDLMMQQAMGTVMGENRRRLNLAVDSINEPALRLYYRHGMQRTMSRIALIRDLRKAR